MKPSKKSVGGTSFHNHTFKATPAQLKSMIGDPTWDTNDGSDKSNLEWIMETESGEVFTIYDWKYYRPLRKNEVVQWHIGGHSSEITQKALLEIMGALTEKSKIQAK